MRLFTVSAGVTRRHFQILMGPFDPQFFFIFIGQMSFLKFSFFFIVSIGSAFSQSKIVDSLTQKLEGAAGKEKIDILNQLTFELISKDNGRAMNYCDQALSLSNQLHYEKGAGLAFTYKGVFEYLSGEFSDGRTNLFHGLALSTKVNDKKNRGYALLQLGNSYMNQSVFDSSLIFYNKSYEILKDSADPVILSKLYKNLGNLYGIRAQTELQKKYLLRSLHIRELLNDPALIANALIALASLAIQEVDFAATTTIFIRIEKYFARTLLIWGTSTTGGIKRRFVCSMRENLTRPWCCLIPPEIIMSEMRCP